jgi:hypothetical protein
MSRRFQQRGPAPRRSELGPREGGFTLVELVIYTGILGLILVFLSQFIVNALLANAHGNAREATINNAVVAVNAIDFAVRHADALYEPTSVFGAGGQLSLVTSVNVVTGERVGYVDIYISDDERLCIKKDYTGVVCVTSDAVRVTNVQFTNIDPPVSGHQGVQTLITLEYKSTNPDIKTPFSLQSSSNVRGYE